MTPVLVLRPPRRRWHRIGFVAVCCYAVGQLVLVLWPPLAWRMLALPAMGVVYAVWAWTWLRASVEVRPSGLTVNHGGLRRRSVAWADIATVRVDLLIGPRALRCQVRNGKDMVLPELNAADVAVVLDAHRAATTTPPST